MGQDPFLSRLFDYMEMKLYEEDLQSSEYSAGQNQSL